MGILDFFSREAGQRRRAALDDFGRDLGYYVPPELRSRLGLLASMNPVEGVSRSMQASERMTAPGRTPMQRVGDAGEMLSEVAGVVAPVAVAGRAGIPAAQAMQEALLGFSAPRTASEAMARNILDLRAAGRANEVTEEMMAAADDTYMYFNTPLPMDVASRNARADEFSPSLHGTGADISAVDPAFFGNGQDLLGSGFYTTTTVPRAERYVPSTTIDGETVFNEGGNILPLMVREPRPFVLEEPLGDAANEIAKSYGDDPFFDVQRMSSGVVTVEDPRGPVAGIMLDPYQQRHWALQKMRNFSGPSHTSDVLSEAGFSGVSGPEALGNRVTASYDPANIRSRFARFDPAFAHLRNLSAGFGGLGLLGIAAGNQPAQGDGK